MGTDHEFKADEDEARMWKRADELEEILNNSGFIYYDEGLTRYINDVLHNLVGDLEKSNNVTLRAYVIKDPFFNAFCLPNGAIYIHTSILAHTENEAQLAMVLGHEATHFFHRDSLKNFRSIINKTAFLSFWTVTTAGAGAYGDLARLVVSYTVVGSVYGYAREIERDADETALNIIINAGYDPKEAKRFLENMYEATKDDKVKVPYFYHTHPRTKARIRIIDGLIGKLSEETSDTIEGIKNAEGYIRITKNVLLDNAELDMKRSNFTSMRRQIERYINVYGEDFKGCYLLGRLDVLESKTEEAKYKFQKSITLNAQYPDSHRELGMLYYKKGDKKEASILFSKYLQLKPDANDADYIRRYLDEEEL
jgi:predicted Zn-dependent protease